MNCEERCFGFLSLFGFLPPQTWRNSQDQKSNFNEKIMKLLCIMTSSSYFLLSIMIIMDEKVSVENTGKTFQCKSSLSWLAIVNHFQTKV